MIAPARVRWRSERAPACPAAASGAAARPPAQDQTGTLVELEGVAKRFGERRVLDQIDLRIEPGSFVSVVGQSGGGKSTLLRLVAGLELADQGEVRLDGAALHGLAPTTTMMFQDARLLPWQPVLENVGITRGGDWRRDATEALRQIGLADRARDWPGILSGGQRQRVALARALVSRPHLLLLDEPLGALDALTRLDMQNLIERLWHAQRFTAVLVTHDVAEAIALSDRVLVIKDGGIAGDYAIDLTRPRARASSRAAELEATILDQLLG